MGYLTGFQIVRPSAQVNVNSIFIILITGMEVALHPRGEAPAHAGGPLPGVIIAD
jgi:hypothetical protein